MLTRVDNDIWTAEGPTVSFFGFPYPTRMTVIRLSDGALWICSPVPLDATLRTAVSRHGEPRYLVSPNKLHHLFLAEWKDAWPEAKLYASPGLARRRPDLTFHAELDDTPDPAWEKDVDQVIFHGSLFMEEVVFLHRSSRTVIFSDLIQRFDAATLPGWRGVLMRLDGLVGPEGSTPREWRLSFWDRTAARGAKQKVLDWNPRRLVVAHGLCARENGREVVERALRWIR